MVEIAPGLSGPIVVMSGVGKVRRDRLVTAGGARPDTIDRVARGIEIARHVVFENR